MIGVLFYVNEGTGNETHEKIRVIRGGRQSIK